MNLEGLIRAASIGPVHAADVELAANESGQTITLILDALSRRIADSYTNAEYDFATCDAVMTNVFTYAHVTTEVGLSPFAWGVFEAFDQGEFRGEDITKCLIAIVLRRGYLMLGDCS